MINQLDGTAHDTAHADSTVHGCCFIASLLDACGESAARDRLLAALFEGLTPSPVKDHGRRRERAGSKRAEILAGRQEEAKRHRATRQLEHASRAYFLLAEMAAHSGSSNLLADCVDSASRLALCARQVADGTVKVDGPLAALLAGDVDQRAPHRRR